MSDPTVRNPEISIKADETLKCLQAEFPRIAEGTPVVVAYLYGSVVRNEVLPDSDVDIAIILDRYCRLTSYERMKLEFDIASQVQDRCGIMEADVRAIDQAPLAFQGKVLTQGQLIFSRDELFRVNYEVFTRKKYFDFLPVIIQMQEALVLRIKADGLIRNGSR